MLYNWFLNKKLYNKEIFYSFLYFIVYIGILDSKHRLFFAYSQYYNLLNYFNTTDNIILLLIMLFAIKTTILKKYSITSIITPLLVFGYYGLYTPYTIFSCTVLVNQKINNNLLNGIMLIHPPILYIAYACICVSTYIAIQSITDHYTQQKNFFKNVDRIFLVQSVLLIISVLLGCWWAEQELAWGGWWSWDFVEILALCILLYSLVYTHEKYFTKKYSVHLLFFLLLTFSIISVRYNIINSIHNFSLTNTINQYLYYLNGLFVLVIVNIVYKIFYKYITQPNTTTNYYNTSIIINLLILLFIYYTINYFNIKIFIYNLTYINLLKIIFFIITIFFLDFFYYGFVVLFLFFCTNILCMYILVVGVILTAMQQNNSRINYYTHLVLLFFLCLSTLQYYIFCNNTTFFDYGVINLWLLKFNQFTTTIYNIQCADHYYHLNNTLISFLFDVQTNMVAVIKGTAMENIFGKNITTHDSIYIEKINQTDNQLFISFIFYQIFLVLFFLVLFFLVLFFSKNRITYI